MCCERKEDGQATCCSQTAKICKKQKQQNLTSKDSETREYPCRIHTNSHVLMEL